VEFREVLRRRRMVRNYTEEPVDPAAVSRIAAAALRAPSAGYSQGLAVVAITDAATRGRIAEAAGEAGYVARGFDPWVSRAPVHLVISVSEAAYHRRYRMPDKLDEENREISWPVPYWWVDAGAALMAVLLAAVDEGLAAGFLGAHAVHTLRSVLDLPDEYAPIGIVTIGHPAPDRRSGSLDLGRRPEETVLHWNRWGTNLPPV
jgi:nitroreductase